MDMYRQSKKIVFKFCDWLPIKLSLGLINSNTLGGGLAAVIHNFGSTSQWLD